MNTIKIAGRTVGGGQPTYVIAEMSANHHNDFNVAVELLRACASAGADAVKLQTYTADTLTIQSDRPEFRIGGGTLWDGRTLYDLYCEASMPWEWQPKLKEIGDELGVAVFSSPFDATSVEFLEAMDVPAYKVASPEIVDLPLIERMARTGKPLIISTGMATLSEIDAAISAARSAGASEVALLKCTSAYPAPVKEMNLRTIQHLSEMYGVPAGLSDHTLGLAVPLTAVALGATIIEKHVTLSRADGGPDSGFSLEVAEFTELVSAIRTVEAAIGEIRYGPGESESKSKIFRRSLYVVSDMSVGDRFSEENVRSIRPSAGLPPKHLKAVLGRKAIKAIAAGTPLSWDLISATVE